MTESEHQDRLYQLAEWIKDGMITKDEAIYRSHMLERERLGHSNRITAVYYRPRTISDMQDQVPESMRPNGWPENSR